VAKSTPAAGKHRTSSPTTAVDRDGRLRMRDLVRESGLTRETIHFYIAQGLLPRGRKIGRNSVVYGPEHLARLREIRLLKDQHFLPLRGIRKILNEADNSTTFTAEQEAMLQRARMDLPERLPGRRTVCAARRRNRRAA
jgi:DNA-binding transcriptional MerR regulator